MTNLPNPALLLIVIVFMTGCGRPVETPMEPRDGRWNLPDRLAKYRRLVEEARVSSPQIVADYAPASTIQIDDFSQSISGLLSELPGVESVTGLDVDAPDVDAPSQRIVHLVDRSLPVKEKFLVCLRTMADGGVSPRQLDALYQDYIQQIELIQIEQSTILKCLSRHHALRRVVVWHAVDQVPPLLEIEGLQFEVRKLDRSGDPSVVTVNDRYGRIRLPETSEVLDRELQTILSGSNLCFVVADVDDLSERVHRLSNGKCEYLRVTTTWGEQASPLDPNVWGR